LHGHHLDIVMRFTNGARALAVIVSQDDYDLIWHQVRACDTTKAFDKARGSAKARDDDGDAVFPQRSG
jgi:hypothetical protein